MGTLNLVTINGSLGTPSRTRSLVEAVVAAIGERTAITVNDLAISDLAADLGALTNPKAIPPRIKAALDAITAADLLVVGSPVYKGSYTGLFKHLIDFIDPAALAGVPVLLSATGGTPRHALVIEHQLRPLFGFFSALTIPTGVFALDSDFENYRLTNPDIAARVRQAAAEAVALAVPGRRLALASASAA